MDMNAKYLNTQEIAAFLGLGLNKTKLLCKQRPHNFPVVRIGNRYQAEATLLKEWRDAWYSGAFTVDL